MPDVVGGRLAPGKAQQIGLGVNPPIVPVRERDVQPIAEIADLCDGDAGKPLREAAVEARAGTVGAFAGEAEFFGGDAERIVLRRAHEERGEIVS